MSRAKSLRKEPIKMPFVDARSTVLIYSHQNVNVYCVHLVFRCKDRCQSGPQGGWRVLLYGSIWWDRQVVSALFLVVLVDAG